MGSGLAIIYFYVTFETEDIVHQGVFWQRTSRNQGNIACKTGPHRV
jgi:ribosomal protein L4